PLRWNDELRQVLRGVSNPNNWRTRQIRSPYRGIGVGKEEHEVGRPMWRAVAAEPLLRHHVTHRPGFHWRQLFPGDGRSHGLVHLSWRASRQAQIGDFGDA